MDAELQAHETLILHTHTTHQTELQERIFCYQEEILEMRTQVSNIRASKLAADRCISDLETELDRARRDGDLGLIRVQELEAKIALYEYTAAATLKQQQQQQQDKTLEQDHTSTPVSKTIDDDGTVTPTPWTVTSVNSTGSDATDIMTPAGKQAPLSHAKMHGIPMLVQNHNQYNITPKKTFSGSPRGSPPITAPTSHIKSHDTKNHHYTSPQKMVIVGSSSSSLVKKDGDNGSSETDDHFSSNEMTEMQLESVIARLEVSR